MADSNSGDTHLLVAEISHKMMRSVESGNASVEQGLEKGKTKEEIQMLRASKLPSKIFIDPRWYKAYSFSEGSKEGTVVKFSRLLPKGKCNLY